jgi:hypothetical protein
MSLESFADLQKGGEHGAAVLPGQADSSRMIRVLTGQAEPKMPPEGEKAPTADEIALLKAWINAGAKGPSGAELDRKMLITPKVPAASNGAQRIASLAYSPDGKVQAITVTDSSKCASITARCNCCRLLWQGKRCISPRRSELVRIRVSGVYGLPLCGMSRTEKSCAT